ncbi:response regulator [Niabella aurantiaca]|uniref:response regulator n=1 Tax=Niabella aurantiaca TaxID=379900 RepID=UPI0003721D3A|nr:response regulator transcription factor [Niabella aurantiaca]
MHYSVVIYDDNIKLCQSLTLLLNNSPRFKVKAGFQHCDDVEDDLEKYFPDIVIMDIDMPGIGGIKGVEKAKIFLPDTKIVMHTVFDDDSRIFDSICAGADGYLLKNTAPLKLIQSLEELMEGGAAMSPFIAKRVFTFFRESKKLKNDFHLTGREQEILEWLVKGHSYKMIAAECDVTIDTVKKHLQNIYHKLHVNCSTEAVAKALIHKIVKVE